ncbi:hypothetical protein MMC26_001895 [Xylographa opegraphella]|nr:hypothetical protein [Xylographa opegraphella]
MEDFYVEDTVALKDNPSLRGVVDRTWRDISSMGTGPPENWIYHRGVPKRVRSEFFRDGRCQRGFVFVHFSWPHVGCTLIAVNSLVLVDRALAFGDVVKRQPSDTASGCVTRTSIQCTIQPIYNGLPINDAHPWPHKEKDNVLHDIPGSDLEFMYEYNAGDYVLYHDWVGVIEDVWEDVAIRLENGSIVVVEKSEELEVLEPDLSVIPSSTGPRSQSLAEILAKTREFSLNTQRLDLDDDGFPLDPPVLYLGQSVFTQKGNLRRGRFIYGSYDPNIRPQGIIVDLKAKELDIRWLSRNVFDESRTHTVPPPTHLDSGDFDEIILYDRGRSPQSLQPIARIGSEQGSDFAVGDVVKFRDTAGAAVKYAAENGKQGMFRRIPRSITQGYEMNVFLITETKTKVTIQWQDASSSDVDATSVVPYLNVDDHDVWPGELVSIKANKAEDETLYDSDHEMKDGDPGVTDLKNVGVVQSADAKERLAKVRWFAGSRVSILEGYDNALLAGSQMGVLSSDQTDVSLYEIVTHPALTKRRGDLVLVAPLALAICLDSSAIPKVPNGEHGWNRTLPSEPGSKIDWFGEVVDLGLDGFLTVRLGALDRVLDIRIPVEATITVISDDDSLDGSLTDEDERASWTESWNSDSDIVIEETVEYEGGTRLDEDSTSEMWSTDEEGLDALEAPLAQQPTIDVKRIEPLEQPPGPTEYVPNDSKIQQISFTTLPNMPAQFMMLDEPPPINHHFYNDGVVLTAPLMRRIRKEHKILESSLPEGIWVRTWEDRLDLLRVLIIGPEETPYSLAPFVLDFHFNGDFPHSPPEAYFHSWTRGLGRINPNLYEDGKVCLSLLGTWPGDSKDESWSDDSTMLQVLVSLMGLVLVKEPFYNEAGFDAYVGSSETQVNSALYTEKAFVMTKGFINHALSHQSGGIENIITWLYLPNVDGPCLLQRVLMECDKILDDVPVKPANVVASGTSGLRLSSGAKVLLRKYASDLRNILAGAERKP